jgi:ATP-binding cassette subfamily B multidrug efflux pump
MLSRRFWGYIWRHKHAYQRGYAAVFASIIMAQLSPWALKLAIDGIRQGISSTRLLGYAGALVLLAVLEAGFSYAMRLQILGAALKIEAELRRDYFAHLQRMHLGFFQAARTGDLMARAVNDIRAVQRFAGVGLMRSFHTTIMLLASLVFMLAIDVKLTLWTMMILPLVSVLFVTLGREIHRRFDRVQAQFSDLSARVQENFSGVRVVKALAQEAAETAAFRAQNEQLIAANLDLARIQSALWPAIGLILGVASVMLLWQGGASVITARITIGQMVQFSYYLARLSFPMIALGWVTNLWQQGRASMARLDEVFDRQPQITDPPHPLTLDAAHGRIEFRNVTFAYGSTPVLHHIDLDIPTGSTVAIVGPTGAGKSTLVHLIPRLFDPTAGQVLVDGHDVRQISLPSLRGVIGIVPQETFLFSDTVFDNIAFGTDRTNGQTVAKAAEVSRIAQDIEDFPLKYATVVGERGVTLSGGQKQRTAIARALARDPKILILDDALSSVDTQTEEEILTGLRSLRASRTCILISHRISTIRDADLIVVLNAGRIVERGTHASLLALGGLYADLYEKQLLREALEAEEGDEVGDSHTRGAAHPLGDKDGPGGGTG